MRIRLFSYALLLGALSTAIVMPMAAFAQTQGPGQGQGQGRGNAPGQNKGNTFPVTGTGVVTGTETPADFTGTFVVQEFKDVGGKLVAHGVLSGKVTAAGQSVDVPDKTVDVPVKSINNKTFAADTASDAADETDLTIAQVPGCDILNLILGPLHLDLLGLVVDLNQVILNITGQTGAGNLLGNVLCALTGILDSNAALAPIINLLNAIELL